MEIVQHYQEKNISEIKDDDVSVAITGTVVSNDGNGFIIDDGYNSLKVIIENNVKNKDYVRVFGKLVKSREGLMLYGEAVQDLNKIDRFLYQKVKKIIYGELH